MKSFLKEYLSYSKRQRNAVLTLLCIIFLLIIAPFFVNLFTRRQAMDFTAFEQDIAAFELAQLTEKDYLQVKSKQDTPAIPCKAILKARVNLFPFNPNNLSAEQWKQLGLGDRQIKIIKNYEAKGGKFYKKEDLKKIYGIPEHLYNEMEAYIQIPERTKERDTLQPIRNKNVKSEAAVIELNTTDAASLESLNGIGTAFASGIISYRRRLGGFISKEQVMEVNGLDSIVYGKIADKLVLDTGMIKKMDINYWSVYELKKHPYLNYNLANSIVNYRARHGNYKHIEEIKNLVLVNEELYRKLAPYLTVE